MVFCNERLNGTGEIVVYSNYHRYWEDQAAGIRNPKLATGGRRDKDIHLRIIGTLEEMDITGDVVLLMDDVTTTGNSLIACKEILINNGAKTVEMFALGRAVRD